MERVMEIGTGRSWVRLEWRLAGEDILIAITGGEAPHIGAAALAWQERGAAEVSPLSVPGHRESEVACSCAGAVCRAVGRTVLVSCGIHIDRAERWEIERLCAHAALLTQRLIDLLQTDHG